MTHQGLDSKNYLHSTLIIHILPVQMLGIYAIYSEGEWFASPRQKDTGKQGLKHRGAAEPAMPGVGGEKRGNEQELDGGKIIWATCLLQSATACTNGSALRVVPAALEGKLGKSFSTQKRGPMDREQNILITKRLLGACKVSFRSEQRFEQRRVMPEHPYAQRFPRQAPHDILNNCT